MDNTIEKTISNLEQNNMQVHFVNKRTDVVKKISQIIKDGETIAVGGSVTLFECDVINYLRCGKYNFFDRYAEGLTEAEIHDIHRRAFCADTYICSSNALTEDGELYNVDRNGNRIAAIAYGPKSVIIVVGINKIVSNLNEAVERIKKVAAPAVCRIRGFQTFCYKNDICASLNNENSNMTEGCKSLSRICCSYLVTGKQSQKDRIKVIIVNENVGF